MNKIFNLFKEAITKYQNIQKSIINYTFVYLFILYIWLIFCMWILGFSTKSLFFCSIGLLIGFLSEIKNINNKINNERDNKNKCNSINNNSWFKLFIYILIIILGILFCVYFDLVDNISGSSSIVVKNTINKISESVAGSIFIPPVFKSYDKLSPLESLTNYQLLINILIIVHFFILSLIILHKYYSNKIKLASTNLISKYLNQDLSIKFINFMITLSKYGDTYLLVLIVLNVFLIVFYLFFNIYISIELSNHLDEYISLHNNFVNKKDT